MDAALNAVRLQLHALVYSLGNFLRTLATPEPIKDWSLTSLKEKLIKIGAKVVSHGRYVGFQMAEVAIPRNLFADILWLIAKLRPPAGHANSMRRHAARSNKEPCKNHERGRDAGTPNCIGSQRKGFRLENSRRLTQSWPPWGLHLENVGSEGFGAATFLGCGT